MTHGQGHNPVSIGAMLTERAGGFVHWAVEAQERAHKKRVVHQLRTNARRLESAVTALRPALRKGESKRLITPVKELRRIAGEARDADVIGKRLAKRLESVQHPQCSAAIGYLLARLGATRDGATDRLAGLALKHADHVRTLGDDLASCEKKAERPLGAIASEGLRDAALRFASASEQDLTDLTLLHELRKDGKRLRYTVEVFKPLLPPVLAREVLARLTDFQQRVGVINDRHVELELITVVGERKDSGPVACGLSLLAEEQSRALEREHAAFVRWWWDVGAAQQLLGCAHELSVVRSEAAVA
ncbi:MAG: CHAD domain-containing protein [Phycisphaerales bacterium]